MSALVTAIGPGTKATRWDTCAQCARRLPLEEIIPGSYRLPWHWARAQTSQTPCAGSFAPVTVAAPLDKPKRRR